MLDLAAVKSYLGIAADDDSQDDYLQLVVDAVNQYVEDATLMNYSTTPKTRSEVLDMASNVYLGRMGILTVTALKLYQDGTEDAPSTNLDTDSYSLNKATGRLTLDFTYGDDRTRDDYNSVHITYTYGMADGETVPSDLKLAALQLAREYYEGTSGSDSRRVTSERTGSYSVTFSDTSVVDNVIKRYRVPRV